MKKSLIWIIYGIVIVFLIVSSQINKAETDMYYFKQNECLESSQSYELYTKMEVQEDSILVLTDQLNQLIDSNE